MRKQEPVYFTDGNGVEWVWDQENEWLDVVYDEDERRDPSSGYLAKNLGDVMQILIDGGFV
jgi:catechol-2,3-dioxygenase